MKKISCLIFLIAFLLVGLVFLGTALAQVDSDNDDVPDDIDACYNPSAPDGLISYWGFEDASGTTAVDSLNVNPGTVYGATWTTGMVGGALKFDGIDDYVSIPDSDNWDFGNGDFTIDFWMRTPSNARATHFYIITKGYNDSAHDGNYGFALNNDLSSIWFWSLDGQSNSEGVGASYNFNTDTWYHIALVKEGNYAHIYIDSSLSGTGTINKDLGGNTASLLIGTYYAGNPAGLYEGCLDEMAIYNRALTPEEIQTHYEDGLIDKGYCEIHPTVCGNGLIGIGEECDDGNTEDADGCSMHVS